MPRRMRRTGQPSQMLTTNTATSQKLLDDLQGKFYSGGKPESVQKLVADGILPAGSTVIDFNQVRTQLTQDKAALDAANGKQPTDTAAATKDVTDAQGAAGTSKKALDDAQAAVDPVQKKIDDRNQQDKNTQADYATVSGALKTDRVYKEDLTKLAADASQPQNIRDAASHLLGTYHDARQQAGRASVTVSKSDYGDKSWTGYPYIDKASIDAGVANHQTQNAADQKTLDPLVAARDAAKATNDTANQDLGTKQKTLDDLNQGNKDITDQKTALGARVAEEQAALTPNGDVRQVRTGCKRRRLLSSRRKLARHECERWPYNSPGARAQNAHTAFAG